MRELKGGGRGWNGPKKADTTAGTGPPAVTKVILGRVPQNTDSTFEIHVGILITDSGGGCLCFLGGQVASSSVPLSLK